MMELNKGIDVLNYFVLQLVLYKYLSKQNTFFYRICKEKDLPCKILEQNLGNIYI